MFSPLAFPAGLVLYDLSAASPPASQISLSPFELHREPLLVIGVADGGNVSQSTDSAFAISNGKVGNTELQTSREEAFYRGYQEELGKFISGYPKALVHRILLFDHIKTTTSLPEGLVIVPPLQNSNTTTIKTVMCDLTSQLLAEMTTYAKSLQALSSVETPRAEYSGAIPNGILSGTSVTNSASRPTSARQESRSRSPSKSGINPQNRMSMPVHMPSTSSSRAATPDGRPLSPPGRSQTPPTTFDDIAAARGASSPSRPGVNDGRRQSRDSVFLQGFGAGGSGEKERIKGKGRVGTVIGALYLLAGRWPDALRELVDSATIARANGDYVWLAKALDCILVTLLMYAWAGMDFKVSLQSK